MRLLTRFFPCFAFLSLTIQAATIGTVVNITGGASDMVLDERQSRLYLVRPSPYDQIDVYSLTQRRVTNSIRTDSLPLAAALSRDGKRLYVTCHNSSSLNVIDLDRLVIVAKISLPARPEGVAVGVDGRVLITTIGSGTNNLLNTLLIYNPAVVDIGTALVPVAVAPPPPLPPTLPALAGRIYLANRSQLLATPDGTKIIGVNSYQAANRVVFVYDAFAGTVPKSRAIGDVSTNISVSTDGSRFMLGLRLFDTKTLGLLAAQNAANAMFPFSTTVNAQGFVQVGQQFNLQQNQGGSVFAQDGSRIYSAFNIAPIQNPAARANVTHLLISDPDNLLINTALQLPENLAGKMVLTADGGNLYALSESGFTIVPLNTLNQNTLLRPSVQTLLLASDQCQTAPEGRRAVTSMLNDGRSTTPVQASLTLLQSLGGAAAIPGLGAVGGIAIPGIPGAPGGGAPGGGVIINLPNIPGAVVPGRNTVQNTVAQTAPQARVTRVGTDTALEFTFNAIAGRSLGTVPAHDFLLTSAQAVNVAPRIRVYQNSRNSEARGTILPVDVSLSPNEALVDMIDDTTRQRIYIANSGMNRVEILDKKTKRMLNPIKVGQLPRSLAMSPDGNVLYVANTGSEFISVIDLDRQVVSTKIIMPPIPFNGLYNPIQPSVIAATQRGPLVVMSNGTLWRVVGNELVPRTTSQIIGTPNIPAPRSMAATPNGEFALLMAGNGNVYLYDASVDDFVQSRQVATNPIQGYYGPVAAGPRGQYFVANGLVLNQSLSPISGTGLQPTIAGAPGIPGFPGFPGFPGVITTTTTTRSISAVATGNGTIYARFTQPPAAAGTAAQLDVAAIELLDPVTGQTLRTTQSLEGPLSTVTGTQRVNIDGRTLVVDLADNFAYAITNSGISVVPIDVPNRADVPLPTRDGLVNLASYQPAISQNGLISIFGQNLGASASASTNPLPTFLGGLCVTLGQTPLPLILTSANQINALIPADATAGRNTIVIRNVDRKAASGNIAVTIAKTAPAVITVSGSAEALVLRANGEKISKKNPAKRDERLVMYAVGLGVPKGTILALGAAAPADKVIKTDAIKLYFGDSRYKEAEIIVDSSTFAPGLVGVYQINFRIPGAHLKGDSLPIMIRSGAVDSPIKGPVVPTIAVD